MLGAAALAAVLLGCSHSRTGPSNLQRLDELGMGLARVGALSSRLAADVTGLNGAMQGQAEGSTRLRAMRLRRDALAFSGQAGRLGNQLRSLARSERRRSVRTYLQLAVETLACQWMEGRLLVSTADLVRSDPLVLADRDVIGLHRLMCAASSEAHRAQEYARRAEAIRVRFRRDFAYVPVHEVAAAGKPASRG